MTYQELLDRSAALSALIRRADAAMLRDPNPRRARLIRRLELEERDARRAVRQHPDHSYDGL